MILHRIINKIKRVRALRNGDAYVKYIRKLGVEIGEGYFIPEPKQIEIDITRPSLVTIGNNVRLNIGFTLLPMILDLGYLEICIQSLFRRLGLLRLAIMSILPGTVQFSKGSLLAIIVLLDMEALL